MQREKTYRQHGALSCYDHSLAVAHLSLRLALRFRLRADLCSIARGALLHDYFLYDWHTPDEGHDLHGFAHARTALENAAHDFELNRIERDIIAKHMFPLNPAFPLYKESAIVTLADKLCALGETLRRTPRRSPTLPPHHASEDGVRQ